MRPETIEPMEAVLFTKISEWTVRQSKLGSLAPCIKMISMEYGLNPSKKHHFCIIKKIIIRSAQWN